MNQPVMTTAPSGSIPLTRRQARDMTEEQWRGFEEGLAAFLSEEREEDEHAEDEAYPAAGVALVTPANEALFLRWAPGHPRAGQWAFPGGSLEDGEDAATAARRECAEEIDVKPGDLALLNRNADHGADYSTFKAAVSGRFVPTLSGEHDAYIWTPLGAPPSPLHPGVEHLLKAGYMNSRRAAADTALAYDRMPKVKTGRSFVLALDRESVRRFDKDGRLHIAETNICKACVSPYKGSEIPRWEELGLDPDRIYQLLRPPEELEKATPTSNGIQLLRKHIPVSAEDHQPWDVAGAIGTSARWEAPFVKNALTVWPALDIEGVESETKVELSPGYWYEPVMESGTFEGQSFDGRMTKIIFNHVTLVETGRQGGDIVVADSLDGLAWHALERALGAIGVGT